MQQIRAGTIRAYAVTDAKRLAAASDIPTVDEAGLPGFHMTIWNGLRVPKGTPKEIVTKLNGAAVAALADGTVRAQASLTSNSQFHRAISRRRRARRLAEGRSRQMVADHQGREYQGGIGVAYSTSSANDYDSSIRNCRPIAVAARASVVCVH